MRNFEARQAARKKAYTAALAVVLVSSVVVALAGFRVAGSRKTHERLYRDPVKTLLRIAETQASFVADERRYAATLAELEGKGLITAELASGEVEGYRYRVAAAGPASFAVTADPDPARIGSTVHYFVDESHTVRAQDGAPASAASEIIYSPRDFHGR